MADTAPISVLMSTYARVEPDWLQRCLDSLAAQTLPPAEIILVQDGEIPDVQNDVIARFRREHPQLNLVTAPKPWGGLARALNHGLHLATQSWIARMDADDICAPNRFERQWEFLCANPTIDVVCSWHEEFEVEGVPTAVKKTPPSPESIARALNYRNVVSHPTIVVRRELFDRAGTYDEHVGLLEDYDLHLRFIAAGARYACLPEPLVQVRTGADQRNRRGGFRYLMTEMAFRTRSMLHGRITFAGWLVCLVLMPAFRMAPPGMKQLLYGFVRSKK